MEKELECLEKVELELFEFETRTQHCEEEINTIKQALTTKSKKEQAFDIIKKKDVDIYIFKSCMTVDEYNSSVVHIIGETRELTQEEYDLLNEVLLEND